MSTWLTFASAWVKQDKNGNDWLSVSSKGDYARTYNAVTKEGNKFPIKLILLDTDTGNQLEVEHFSLMQNRNKRPDKNDADYEVKIKIAE